MKTGLIIVAAGLSSRMGYFKPLLDFQGKPAIFYLTEKFISCGVKDIIIVTGFRAKDIEKVFDKKNGIRGVHFVYNENFATTQMLDSAILGFKKALSLPVTSVFFTPTDIPLITEVTIKNLLDKSGNIVIPRCNGRNGHPVKINKIMFDRIISYKGARGLKGAIASMPEEIVRVDVDDPHIAMDMDTKEDYNNLLEKQKHQNEVSN